MQSTAQILNLMFEYEILDLKAFEVLFIFKISFFQKELLEQHVEIF